MSSAKNKPWRHAERTLEKRTHVKGEERLPVFPKEGWYICRENPGLLRLSLVVDFRAPSDGHVRPGVVPKSLGAPLAAPWLTDRIPSPGNGKLVTGERQKAPS